MRLICCSALCNVTSTSAFPSVDIMFRSLRLARCWQVDLLIPVRCATRFTKANGRQNLSFDATGLGQTRAADVAATWYIPCTLDAHRTIAGPLNRGALPT